MIVTQDKTLVGHVAEIHRYPVKSMLGERLKRACLGPDGIEGDRRFAVIDTVTGRVASAKKPRKWAGLLNLRAELRNGVLVVSGPDGAEYRSDVADLDAVLSRLLGQSVTLHGSSLASASIEIEWPDVPGLPNAASETTWVLPTGRYVDLAPIHLLTTATLRRFRELTPGCSFEPQRFRPNIVIETLPDASGFVEREWTGRTILIGDMPLPVSAPCSRCVMTTLSQRDLPTAPQFLPTIITHNAGTAGAYGTPVGIAEVAVGDLVWLV